MNSTPSKDNVPSDGPTGRADEQLAHAHEQIVQADEQLTRLSEQLAKLERDDVRPPPAEPGPQPPPAQSSATPPPATPSPPAKPALAVPVGLMLAAGIVVVALVWQSSYGGGVRPPPQLASAPSLPPENPSSQPTPSTVQLASVEAVPPQMAPPPSPSPPPSPPAPAPAPTLAQAAPPQEARPATAAPPPSDQTQLLQTMARDLANLERNIEQLRTNQQQMASDNAKAIGELKASQDEMKRALARVPDQAPPRASSLPAQPTTAFRRPERPRPQVRARPRYPYPREWLYDDW